MSFIVGFAGILLQSGSSWKDVRRFTVAQLKEFGFGRSSAIEPMIEEEAEKLIKILRTKLKRPLSTEHLFNISVFNVLWSMISGQRFELDDP